MILMAVTKFVLNETSYFGEGARSVLADEIKNRGFKKERGYKLLQLQNIRMCR